MALKISLSIERFETLFHIRNFYQINNYFFTIVLHQYNVRDLALLSTLNTNIENNNKIL